MVLSREEGGKLEKHRDPISAMLGGQVKRFVRSVGRMKLELRFEVSRHPRRRDLESCFVVEKATEQEENRYVRTYGTRVLIKGRQRKL